MGGKIFLLILIVAILGPRIYTLIVNLGYHKIVHNHMPGTCKTIEGIENGAEDLELLPNNKVLITSGLRIFTGHKESFKGVKGHILLFDLDKPASKPNEVRIEGLPDAEIFNPHGMSTWIDPSTGVISVYIVCHLESSSVVNKFVFTEADLTLKYLETFGEADENFRLVNDIVVVGHNQFYYTNFYYFRAFYEMLVNVHWGSVGFFDGKRSRIAAKGLLGPNGINVSPDGRFVYVGDLSGVITFKRDVDNTLHHLQTIRLHTMVDNINVDKDTGSLYMGCHHVVHRLITYSENPQKETSPSQVLKIAMKPDGYMDEVTEVLLDDGRKFSGSSGALYHQGKLLVGSVHSKALFCKMCSS